jgi:Cupredoxin-like domain
MTGPRATKLAFLVAAALLAAGCGRTEVLGADRTIRVELTEYRLHPQAIHASPGLLTIVVHNRGVLDHDLVVSQHGQTIDSTDPIRPGQTVDLAIDLAPGKYSMASTLQSDQTLGEYGTLSVGS